MPPGIAASHSRVKPTYSAMQRTCEGSRSTSVSPVLMAVEIIVESVAFIATVSCCNHDSTCSVTCTGLSSGTSSVAIEHMATICELSSENLTFRMRVRVGARVRFGFGLGL